MLTPIRVRKHRRQCPSQTRAPGKAASRASASSVLTTKGTSYPPAKRRRADDLPGLASPIIEASRHPRRSSRLAKEVSPTRGSSASFLFPRKACQGLPTKPSKTFSKDPSTIRKNGTSALERLPTEILQQIFLLCDVFHLPLASPTLSAGLSSEHVYWRCLVRAFNLQTWGDEESVPTMNFLLSRRWMTRALFERLVTRWEMIICPPYDPAHVALHLSSYTRIAEGVRIPLNLLRPPFTDEKDKFLACVIGQGARIDWVRTTDGEVALKSLEIAIREGRLPTIRNLLTRPAVGIRTDLHFVKVAVFDGGCQPDVVDLILSSIRKSDSSIDWLDPDLQRWGRQKEGLGDPQGSWLLFRLKMCSDLHVGEYPSSAITYPA